MVLLHSHSSLAQTPLSWIDALFTATSATCVTGLIVVDTGTYFSGFGQTVIIILIQLGGLGIMTVTGLIFYLWHRRVSLTDRVAVGDSLLHDPRFNLGRFLAQIIIWSLGIEMIGAILISLQAPDNFPPLFALFHAISAFCNAGFSLYSDSLMAWQNQLSLNLTFIALIIIGGIGFAVLMELKIWLMTRLPFKKRSARAPRLSWYAMVILKTTVFLIITGTIAIYLAEIINPNAHQTPGNALLTALFQSVTCRTAGFNTLDIGQLANVSLVIFAGVIISISVLILNITESSGIPHPQTRGLNLDILFEVVSAFATVGLSTGLTPHLSTAGKCVIIVLMFIGRLGPILFLSALQSYQKENLYKKPEESLLIG